MKREPKTKSLICAICRRDNKSEFRVQNTVRGLVDLIEHWKKDHPGRVTTSAGVPIEEMPMGWSKLTTMSE